jgi:hypothetical protein
LIGRQFGAVAPRRPPPRRRAGTTDAFGTTSPTLPLVLGIVAVLAVLGVGVLLPGEVRTHRQPASDAPDPDVIGRLGMRNARLGGLQGPFQLVIVAVSVDLPAVAGGVTRRPRVGADRPAPGPNGKPFCRRVPPLSACTSTSATRSTPNPA